MSIVRRVKCDEDRPLCHRCTSTGRKCDGYEQQSQGVRDAAVRRKGKRPLVPKQPTSKRTNFLVSPCQVIPLLYVPVAEGQTFAFFREHTLHEIPGCFEASCWDPLVLQLSLHEASVRHAAVAVGAMHRTKRGQCPSLDLDVWLERGNSFAVAQYVKSINHLRKRLDGPKDSQCEHVALVTCLLFICFEMLQGNRPGAVAHLRNGLRILLALDSPSVYLQIGEKRFWTRKTSLPHISQLNQLADTYARLDYESTMFGEPSPILTLGFPGDQIGPSLPTPSTFTNITEAKKCLDILSNAVYRLRGELLHRAASNIDTEISKDWAVCYCVAYSGIRTVDLSEHTSLLQQQSCLKFGLEHWASTFKVVSRDFRHHDTQPWILLEMQHFYVYFLVCTLRDTTENCDYFDTTFQRVVALGKQFVDAASSKRALFVRKPTFTLEAGIFSSIYMVAMKCRNSKIRHEAIALLYQTRCQEGMWEGGLIGRFIAEVADMEENAVVEKGDEKNKLRHIPQSARFSDVVVAMSETLGYGHLVCARYLHESTGALEISQKTFRF